MEIATRLRTPTTGKRKAETPTQRTARLEQERDQRTPSYLHFLVGVAMHIWISCTSVFLPGYFTQALFHCFLHKHNICSLHSGHLHTDNAYGVHRPYSPLSMHATYNTAQARPQQLIIICLVSDVWCPVAISVKSSYRRPQTPIVKGEINLHNSPC